MGQLKVRRRGAALQLQRVLALTLTLVLALVRNIIIFSKVRVLVLNQPITPPGPGVGFRQCKKPKKSNPRAPKSNKKPIKINKKTYIFREKKRTKRDPQSGALTPNARGRRTKWHPRTRTIRR